MPEVKLAREAMRTRFELILDGDNPANLRAAGEEALDEVAQAETLLSAYRTDSALFALNARAGQAADYVDARLFVFLQKAHLLSVATKGAFDLTVGPLRRLWETAGSEDRVPTPAEINAALAFVGTKQHLVLNAGARTAGLSREGVRLDPGALGKGWAIDRAGESLRENNVTHALLHGGTSSVLGIGGAWKIAVQHPREPTVHLATVNLHGTSLSVSAAHGKTFRAEKGRRWGHVLDPRTGWPVETNLLAAVVTPSAAEGDALSTALLVLGKEGVPLLAARFPHAGFLLAYAESDSSRVLLAMHGDFWNTPSE